MNMAEAQVGLSVQGVYPPYHAVNLDAQETSHGKQKNAIHSYF